MTKGKRGRNTEWEWVTCIKCNGSGFFPNILHICSLCKGKGQIKATP